MSYAPQFLTDLQNIVGLIKNNQLNGPTGAEAQFDQYLRAIQPIGTFTTISWPMQWREKVWEFGTLFKNKDPRAFLNIIDQLLGDRTIQNKEVIEFIKEEIIFNYLPGPECHKFIEGLILKYPLNPEFRHGLGHFYRGLKKYPEAIGEYRLALKIDPGNQMYAASRFLCDQSYMDDLIMKGQLKEGQDYIDGVFKNESEYLRQFGFHDTFVDYFRRFRDHVLLQNKIENLEEDFKEKMSEELDGERKRIIEVLGFFSAIVAFILATVSIGKSFTFIETVYFIIGLGLVLILFAVSLSILFNSTRKRLFMDPKFWILVISISLILLFIISAKPIASAIQQIVK